MGSDIHRHRYTEAARTFRQLEVKEEKLLVLLSFLRLISFIGGIAVSWYGFTRDFYAGLLLLLASIFTFLYLLKLYSGHSGKREFLGNLATINENEAKALSGDYSAFSEGFDYADIHHDFSYDIDLFGTSSLFQYLDRTVTGYGKDVLAGWLTNSYGLSSLINLRQTAIKELSTKEVWRHDFMAAGMGKSFGKENIDGLLEWMKESDYVKSSTTKKVLIYILPALTVTAAILVASAILPLSVLILLILLNLLFVATGLKTINRIHSGLSKKYYYLSSMTGLLNVFVKESFEAEILNGMKSGISGNRNSAAVSVRKLGRLIQSFDARLNLLVSLFLNGFLLWDYHSVLRLEKWKAEYKEHFPLWLDMIGQADAFVSLANYAANNEKFAYPAVSDQDIILDAKNLGHQLIDEKQRVYNDFRISSLGTVCIISGANMAGKSTFLRTIAVNFILGMTGAPVCASEMIFSPMKLFTSMRTTDSLHNNESYFYAELKRLKILKERIELKEPVLFILDEILKGTNSADKSMGSKLFLKRLTESGATGLIATHDTGIGEMQNEFPGKIVNKCFEIEISGDQVLFDYKLRDGITRKMNAALLMKQMGILD